MNEMWWTFLIETLAITAIGSVLHFTYGWSHQNKFVAIFSAVNESTWEHVKLALSGVFACTLVDVWFFGSNPNYWLAKSLSFVAPVIVVPALFYGYRAILNIKSCLPLDITIFVIAAAVSAGIFVGVLRMPSIGPVREIISMVISVVIIAAYLLLTRFPLHHNFLFEDPITHQYGYESYRKRKKNGRRVRRKK